MIIRKIISAFLAIMMVFSMVSATFASAEEMEMKATEITETDADETMIQEVAEETAIAAEDTETTEDIEDAETTEKIESTGVTGITEATDVTETVEVLDNTVSVESQLDVAMIAQEPLVLASSPSCTIDYDKVSVSVQVASGDQTDDGMLYLFAVPTYVDSVDSQAPIASVAFSGSGTYQLQADLNHNTASSLLYSKFVVAVKSGGVYTALNTGSFIANPEVLASSSAARTNTASKKGIHMSMFIPTDLETLGIKQAFFNIYFDDFVCNTATDTPYTYNGKTYYFNTTRIAEYDNLIKNMTRAGMAITITFLNRYQSGYEYLLHPGVSQRSGTINYAINTSTQQGLETVAAAVHFMAERYNGTNQLCGKVDNWIVGNEVNDNLQYYYMGEQDIDTFVQEYLQTFRVIYTAVKSAYSNANVYMCLEHRWATEDSMIDYGGKNFIDKFNAYAKEQGDMDWGVSYHPYSFPMNDPDILNDGQPIKDQYDVMTDGNEVRAELATPIITMKNIDVLTNYFHNDALLNAAGQVRSIILGEMGYTSYSNIHGHDEMRQAANIALAYYIAEMNPDIDSFLLRTLTDESEGSEYFKFGLRNQRTDGGPGTEKYAYEMYQYIDTTASLKHTEFAKAQLGINDWSAVVPNWNANKFRSMGTRSGGHLYQVGSVTPSKVIAAGMIGQWETGYNVFEIGQFDYVPSFYENGLAVANSFAYFMDYQGIEKHFSTALNLSSSPYLTFAVNFKPMDASGAADKLELRVRLHSGNDVFDAVGTFNANQNYTACLNLSSWAGRSAIDAIEILARESGAEKSFAGTFTVYQLGASSAVSGLNAQHVYNDNVDGTCNACGINRETVETRQVTHMFRMYNPNTGEHFYTGSEVEKGNLVTAGWHYEGVGFTFPANTGAPVHRLFQPSTGEHLYTMDEAEKASLMANGWNYEGIAFNSAYDTEAVQHRLHNPNATVGAYHFTFSTEEMNNLRAAGWEYQGIGWYSCWK